MVLDYAPSTAMILERLGTIVINIVNFKTLKRADRLVVNEWGTLALILLFVTNSVSRFVANLWIGRIKSNLKKKRVFSM